MSSVLELTTGQRIRLLREARGLTRPVLAGLVGRSADWLKKVERDERRLTSLPLLLQVARALSVSDLAELTGAMSSPVEAWDDVTHPVVPAIRRAMYDASFAQPRLTMPTLSPEELQRRVHAAWLLWHSSRRQRTDVGVLLPELIREAHACIRGNESVKRRQAKAAAGDLYRLVQRLLAHISEPELHALAVERGRAMSEDADTPISLALAAWSSAVSLCASGHYDEAVRLSDVGMDILRPGLDPGSPSVVGAYGALQLEAAAAHGLAGRAGDAFRYLDGADRTAGRLRPGDWHAQSAFERGNVQILSMIVGVSLGKLGEAIHRAERLDTDAVPSVVRRSRLLLETAHAYARRRESEAALHYLAAASDVSVEAVALIPWARELADDLAAVAPVSSKSDAKTLVLRLKASAL